MKRVLLVIGIIVAANRVVAQQSPAEQLAQHIAQKMKDSLSLTGQQKDRVFTINMQLHNQKTAAWQRYAGSDSLRIYIQRVERTRDSLYRAVLPEEKYLLYREKKNNLVSNN